MGGGTPLQEHLHPGSEEEDYWAQYRGSRSFWPQSDSGFGVETLRSQSFATEDVLQPSGVSVLSGCPLFTSQESRAPSISWGGESEHPVSGGNALSPKFQMDGSSGMNPIVAAQSPAESSRAFSSLEGETAQHDFGQDSQFNESTNLQKASGTPSSGFNSRGSSGLVHYVRKQIFKIMQIQNDSQDLSFVEKVILSRDDIFSLCNSIIAGSGKSSDGRGIIDFDSLDSKSMKVVGLFGSKDVMREIFQSTKFRDQTDIWMQIQNDSLAPGLYAWVDGDSLFLFYWHQGLSLPKATRKDMSCNFIRYVFDLCDTVCVCLDGKNLKNCLFDSSPKFSKRQRTQRLQISLVKASEDSIKVTDGFVMEGLTLGNGNALPAKGNSQKVDPGSASTNSSGGNYMLSEGLSRVALLVSSKRPKKLSSLVCKRTIKVKKFPAFIQKWTEEHHYTLDVTSLCDSDFVVFIRSAKLKEADLYDKLLESHTKRKEQGKICDVDQLVDIEKEHLARSLEAFIDAFLKTKYPWEENWSSASFPDTPEDPDSRSKSNTQSRPSEPQSPLLEQQSPRMEQQSPRLEQQSPQLEQQSPWLEQQSPQLEQQSPLLEQHSPLLEQQSPSSEDELSSLRPSQSVSILTGISNATDTTESGSNHVRGEEARASAQVHLNKLESGIYSLVLGEDSKQRLVFPTTTVNMFDGLTQQSRPADSERSYVISTAEADTFTSKFAPILYGAKVILRSAASHHTWKTGTFHRSRARDHEGPLLTGEDVIFSVEGTHQTFSMKLDPFDRTGDLSKWLNQQAAEMEFPRGWHHAVLLTDIFQKLAETGREDHHLTEDLTRKTLTSENPLLVLEKILPLTPILEFARARWEELQNLKAPSSEEMHLKAIRAREFCAEKFKVLSTNFHSRISTQTRTFTTSLLNQKIRSRRSKGYEKLEATLKEEEVAFLASQKTELSRRDGVRQLKLTFEACKLTGGLLQTYKQKLMLWLDSSQKISVNFIREEFEKESITWHGLELAPMKEDFEQLITDNEYGFSPTCSASKEIIDLVPTNQSLLKVVFLKAGQLLVFVLEGSEDEEEVRIYLCPKLGSKLSDGSLIKTIRRGFDLIAYDERSRFIAFYDASLATIKTFRFDETFHHMDWTGVEVILGEYAIERLIWMDFVTGKNEIVFIDHLQRVRICEATNPGLVRSGNVHIGHSPIVKACVTMQGSCLLLVRNLRSGLQQGRRVNIRQQQTAESFKNGGSEDPDDDEMDLDASSNPIDLKDDVPEITDFEEEQLTVDVYKLDASIQYVSSTPLNIKTKDWSKLVVSLVSFGSQMHLVIFDGGLPSMLSSKVIKISSASEVCHLKQITRPDEEANTDRNLGESIQSGPVLDFIYQIFEKYATSPPLREKSRDLYLRLLLKSPDFATQHERMSLSEKCVEYIKASLNRLEREKGKDFSTLDIHTSLHDDSGFQSCTDLPLSTDEGSRVAPSAGMMEVQMGTWIRRLACLVPIQIARAEHNALRPMIDGLQLSGTEDYVDAISLANVVSFGLYEPVFDTWTGPVKVISSMGKQSSGKSYLLNHLSGSLLDVAGGRCTDGVWMTIREGNGCLYVLLDFEGLGSFERSEQEDMLLSMLNAAISNLTIFNKKDFHLDKETEAIFERFQNGVSLVKTDAKLFKGLFYMAIKDVDISDVEDLKKEFFSKISQICSKSQDNFLTRMYGGSVEISAMPSFNRPEFHESIADIAQTVEDLDPSYFSGRSLLLDLKLIIAQISTKDWSPIDSKRVALRINLLRKHFQSAVSVGCFFSDGLPKALLQFDDQVEIADESLVVEGLDFYSRDTALELTPFQEKKVVEEILLGLMVTFKSIVPRKGEKDEEWHSLFGNFISALVDRRKRRVLEWIALNTSDFSTDGGIQKLHLEAVALLAEVQQNLLLCSCKCERCFLRCVQEKGHQSSHSCMGDHRCVAMCTYCLDEESPLGAGLCNDQAGHAGPHDCKEKSHTCGKCCTYATISSNCNGNCSKKSGHAGDHQCNSRQHTCNQICSLPSCKNPCVSPIDIGDHTIHACHEKYCPIRCSMTGCNRTCATEDHFHGMNNADLVTQHFCGSEHPCLADCEYKGNCDVLTEVSKKTQTFTGRRATFDYVVVTEQNGKRKGCCIVVPPFKDSHEGPHSHSSNPDAVHFCETRCPSCGYFCTRPMEHGGLHTTTHGNMRDVTFVAESEEIDILDRQYAWGESGEAEMCQMHCKANGRGHIHLIRCPENNSGGACRKLFDGARHEVRKYGPDFDLPKDEMTHAAFWEYVRFEDPCSAEEKKQFALCNHQCKSDEHNPAGGGAMTSVAVQNISYCTESLWHAYVPKSDLVKFGTGYITDDGHHFSCDHTTNMAVNIIFVIDRSSSMSWTDIKPSMTKFQSYHNNRLGCVYEAILRFIRTRLSAVKEDTASVILFNSGASTVVSLQDMKESLVDELLRHNAAGGTTYSAGLQNAEGVLLLATKDARLSRKSPVIIFLSDGGNIGGSDPLHHIAAMKALDPKLQLHTIMFGNDPSRKILEDMAKAGDGTFEVSLDEVQLSRRFEGLAKSLRPQVASLL